MDSTIDHARDDLGLQASANFIPILNRNQTCKGHYSFLFLGFKLNYYRFNSKLANIVHWSI